MGLKITNGATSTLTGSINTTALSLTVQSADAAKFPTLAAGDFFYGTLVDASNNREIVKVTARSTGTMTIVRAQEGTTARNWSAGDRFDLRLTAASLQLLQDATSLGSSLLTAASAADALTALGVSSFAQTLLDDTSAGAVMTTLGIASAVQTWLATPSSANLRAAMTDESGSGALLFAGGALGTPASGTLTNATGLPIATGVSGLGSGVATFLATPSSANLRAAMTDESGGGALLFAGGNIGAATGSSLTLTGDVTGQRLFLVGGVTGTNGKIGYEGYAGANNTFTFYGVFGGNPNIAASIIEAGKVVANDADFSAGSLVAATATLTALSVPGRVLEFSSGDNITYDDGSNTYYFNADSGSGGNANINATNATFSHLALSGGPALDIGSYNDTGGSGNNGMQVGSGGTAKFSAAASSSTTQLEFHNTNGTVGTIRTSGSATSFNTSSDETLKSFIGPYDPLRAIAIIRADPVRDFHWVGSGDYSVGWGAQTSYAVAQQNGVSDLASPGMGWVVEDRDTGQLTPASQTDDGAFYDPWGIDQAKRTPYLWAATTWLLDRVDDHEARIAALEAA